MAKECLACFVRKSDVLENQTIEHEVYHGVGEVEVAFLSKIHPHEAGVVGRVRTALNRSVISGEIPCSHLRIFRTCPERSTTRYMQDGFDLNRLYIEPGEAPAHTKARLLRDVITQNPIRYLFSFHEEHEEGYDIPFHVYDVPQHTNDLVMEARVERLTKTLIGSIKQAGYDVYTGPDDPELSDLIIKDGYLQTVASDHYDKTLETHLVDLGARGLGTVERAFVFDIRGLDDIYDKHIQIGLSFDQFIIPFLREVLLPDQCR